MAYTGSSSFGGGPRVVVAVEDDPRSIAVDCVRGSLVLYDDPNSGEFLIFKKLDDGNTTNIEHIIMKHNMAASTDPTAYDDCTAAYCARSNWYNSSLGKLFICVDDTEGAAVWIQTGG
jgi:hypothetical protein